MSSLAVAGGAAMAVLALLTPGPLGVSHLLSRRAHRVLDLVLVVVLAASPVAARGRLDVTGVVLAEAAALVLLRVSLGTAYHARPPVPTEIEAPTARPPETARTEARRHGTVGPARHRRVGPGVAAKRLVGRSSYLLGTAVGRARRPPRRAGAPERRQAARGGRP